MKPCIVAAFALLLASPAFAQSEPARAGGADFSGFKTYWAQSREGCRPTISFSARSNSSGTMEPIEIRMEVRDKDKKSVFATGSTTLTAADLPAGGAKDIAIGADQSITVRDCLGDMHQPPLSGIHFSVRLSATVGHGADGIEIFPEQPIGEERVPASN
jgi:hypothetical protein